jgi:hypothetical protein
MIKNTGIACIAMPTHAKVLIIGKILRVNGIVGTKIVPGFSKLTIEKAV